MLVTVSIPFYNSERTLRDAIRSIFAQSFQDWELLLIDDGSTDSSLEIAGSVRDPRVKVVSDGKHRGLIFRLNQAIETARGTYIARMDADDISHPARLERQVDFLEKNPFTDVVGSSMYSLNCNDQPCGVRSVRSAGISAFARIHNGVFIHVSIMGKRDWFLKNRYSEGFTRAEDQELWARTYNNSLFAAIPEPLVYVREEGSVSLAKYSQSAKTMRRIFRLYAPKEIGIISTVCLILLSYGKVAVYYGVTIMGIRSLLVHARNRTLSTEERERAGKGLSIVHRTDVKGFS
jgi:glycosyltransferase involved in cell wall biosynthesis